MGIKEQVFFLLAETTVGAVVSLACSEGAKQLWQGIKKFFKGNQKMPPEQRAVVSETEEGDKIPVNTLKEIIEMIPEEVLRELFNRADFVNYGNQAIVEKSTGIVGGYIEKAVINNYVPPEPDHHADAMRFFQRKQYGNALTAFEKAIVADSDNSETYFYAAICLLQGKRPFRHQRPTINKVEEYLNCALAITPKGIYYYFQAYIKFDYFEMKHFAVSPTWQQALQRARTIGYSSDEVDQLYSMLGTNRPACL